MLKVAYVYDLNNKYSYATRSVATGFKNAFKARGDQFMAFDSSRLDKQFIPLEKARLLRFNPDIIFAPVSKIAYLPLNLLKKTALVFWGEFYSPCFYEAQIDNVSKETKDLLNKYSTRNNILVWSQHDKVINDQYFGGYEKELGVKFIQLLHCADKTQYTEPILEPEFDFLWIGNISHRIETYNSFIAPLKGVYSNYLEYNEHNMITPESIEAKRLYQRSHIAPNIHTPAQIKERILVNERVFSSTMLGGFQICDNPLASQYFNEDELVIATTKDEFIDKMSYYRTHLQERFEMIKKMQENILSNHTYFNRIDSILKALKL
ncbi:glycosyltransferase [Pedobacter sp. B4-66]|uniref:glycosyltransferase n=1 Tax=Pedobacter sp. B4-66 TaxID=2817280 RepID=UPI001BDB0B46|nr:glycosyltransferase [Pedobacter sp. B4-66]